MAKTVTVIGIGCNLRGPPVLINPACRMERIGGSTAGLQGATEADLMRKTMISGGTAVMDGPGGSGAARPKLFQPLTIRNLTLKNRLVVPPMVHYRCDPGHSCGTFHLVHLGRYALGGFAASAAGYALAQPVPRPTVARPPSYWPDKSFEYS